mmetsp:Transcript_82341/g.191194  ORF Transcript_82341/g.191194 Transcript_82341/m.191194 type:complete len:267 (-) Transcript_82341:1829-2629(-)
MPGKQAWQRLCACRIGRQHATDSALGTTATQHATILLVRAWRTQRKICIVGLNLYATRRTLSEFGLRLWSLLGGVVHAAEPRRNLPLYARPGGVFITLRRERRRHETPGLCRTQSTDHTLLPHLRAGWTQRKVQIVGLDLYATNCTLSQSCFSFCSLLRPVVHAAVTRRDLRQLRLCCGQGGRNNHITRGDQTRSCRRRHRKCYGQGGHAVARGWSRSWGGHCRHASCGPGALLLLSAHCQLRWHKAPGFRRGCPAQQAPVTLLGA